MVMCYMPGFRIPILTLLPCVVLAAVCAGAGETTTDVAAQKKEAATAWSRSGWPILQQFCLDCHDAETREGELDLSSFETLGAIERSDGPMQRVLEMVRFGAMPPEDADQPSDEQRKQLVDALDRAIYAVSCDLRPRPGKVTARRLNRAEYNHSIRDLFGMDLRPADAFPSDEVGAGFDNNGDVLSLSPLLVEKYLDAAESVATQVLIDPAALPRLDDERPSDQLLVHGETKTGRFNGRFLARDAFVWADFKVRYKGEYRVRVRAGNSDRNTPETRVAVYDQDGVLRGLGAMSYYGGSGRSQRFDFRLTLEPGSYRFYVEPIEPGDDDDSSKFESGTTVSQKFANMDASIVEQAKEKRKKLLKPDNNIDHEQFPFMVRQISVEGPREFPTNAYPPSQRSILRREARRDDGKWHGVEEAARECLRPLMRRAFRGPVTDDDLRPYVDLVSSATDRGESFHRGLQMAISAVLVSPRFLFRVETPSEGMVADEDGSMPLTQHQLATRLSYFLWSSTPDESLLDAADKGELNSETLAQQVRRMIEDEKADALAGQFAAQWLGLRNLDEHEADTERFKKFTPSLRQAMARETEILFMHLARENRPVAELLTTDYTFVNSELAGHYSMTGIDGDAFQRVSLASTPRRGLLSHASVLTLTSNPARTSPVKRGKWILENVLGTPPPDPPAGVPELEETPTAKAKASLREQLEIHRANPSCASCHRVMDQLGFGLEQYDAIGRFRKESRGRPIDASGELPGGHVFNGAAELSELLRDTQSEAFAHTVVERLLTFALGRELSPSDRCTVDEIIAGTSAENHRFIDLVLAVVESRPFQYYEWFGPAETGEEG